MSWVKEEILFIMFFEISALHDMVSHYMHLSWPFHKEFSFPKLIGAYQMLCIFLISDFVVHHTVYSIMGFQCNNMLFISVTYKWFTGWYNCFLWHQPVSNQIIGGTFQIMDRSLRLHIIWTEEYLFFPVIARREDVLEVRVRSRV